MSDIQKLMDMANSADCRMLMKIEVSEGLVVLVTKEES